MEPKYIVPVPTPPYSKVPNCSSTVIKGKSLHIITVKIQTITTLAGWLRQLERHPVHQRVVGLVPGQVHMGGN